MIVKGAFVHLLRPGIRWLWFCHYYPKRKRGENGSRYYKRRKRDYEKWIKSLPRPQEDWCGGLCKFHPMPQVAPLHTLRTRHSLVLLSRYNAKEVGLAIVRVAKPITKLMTILIAVYVYIVVYGLVIRWLH